MCSHPVDSLVPWPIAAPSGSLVHLLQVLQRRRAHSTGTLAPWAIGAPCGALLWLLDDRFPHSKGSPAPSPIAATTSGNLLLQQHCRCAHSREALLQHLQVPSSSGCTSNVAFLPMATMLPRSMQDCHVSSLSCKSSHPRGSNDAWPTAAPPGDPCWLSPSMHTLQPHGQPRSLTHRSISRCSLYAAEQHSSWFKKPPPSRAHCSISR